MDLFFLPLSPEVENSTKIVKAGFYLNVQIQAKNISLQYTKHSVHCLNFIMIPLHLISFYPNGIALFVPTVAKWWKYLGTVIKCSLQNFILLVKNSFCSSKKRWRCLKYIIISMCFSHKHWRWWNHGCWNPMHGSV